MSTSTPMNTPTPAAHTLHDTAYARPTARPPLVDLGTRVSHGMMALLFALSYLTAESEYWRLVHVYSGYVLAGVLVFRLLWGWVGPASARWVLLMRRLSMWPQWLSKVQQGEVFQRSLWVSGSSLMLATAVAGIYAFTMLAILSGWATYNEWLGDGWLSDVLEELHEGLGNAVLAVVCVHLGLVVLIRAWRGPQAVRPMWQGHANSASRR